MNVDPSTSQVSRIVFALRRPIAWMVCPAIIAVALSGFSFGQSGKQARKPVDPNSVKSVYLLHFSRFVTWPAKQAPSTREVRIGVIGKTPVIARLHEVAARRQARDRHTGKKVPLKILPFKSMKDYRACHILLVPDSVPAEEQRAILKRFATSPVLVVGESPGFARIGGTAGFVLLNGNMLFDLSVPDAKRKGLKIDAKLQRLAHKLEEKIQPDSTAVQQVP